MPELPEVETIKRELLPLVGRRFVDVYLAWGKAVSYPSPEAFRQGLRGKTVEEIRRRGKYLLLRLAGGHHLILHLRMTGSLLLKTPGSPPDPYSRSIFYLDDGTELHFRDPRRLGRMWLVGGEEKVVGKLGPEPLDSDFTPKKLGELLKARAMPIKALLLDQEALAGVGNLYADEALFEAQIHPLRKAKELTGEETKRLHQAIRRVLKQGIINKGASVNTYFRPGGGKGKAHLSFKVARRAGEPCPRCSATLERIVVRGRGSYFCPHCQPLNGR